MIELSQDVAHTVRLLSVMAILALAGCTGSDVPSTAQAVSASEPSTDMAIVFGSEMQGEIEPCG